MRDVIQATAAGVLGGACVCLALALAQPAAAREPPRDAALEGARGRGFLSLQIENDLFGNGADRHYTHGTELSYSSEPCAHLWVESLARALRLLRHESRDCGQSRVGFALGQAIFTPADIGRVPPDPSDRPYAGWLYLSASLVVESEEDAQKQPHEFSGRTLKKLEFNIGVIGPASFAEDVQTNYHAFIGAREPKGWSFQLRNEPTLLLSYELQRRYGLRLNDHLEMDATPHGGISLGNVFTHAAAGFTLRIGNHMDHDYGPPSIRPRFPGAAFFDAGDRLGWYLFAGVEGRAVGRNVFLDGNSFRHGPKVDKTPVVGDLQAGIAVTLRNVRLSFTNVYRTREFKTQVDNDTFGAIALSVRF